MIGCLSFDQSYATMTKCINPVGTQRKMNVFCAFKIGSFVPRKKKRTFFRRLENNFCHHLSGFQLQFKFIRKNVSHLFSDKHLNFMILNFMTLVEGMQNCLNTLRKRFWCRFFLVSWIDTRLLIKLWEIEHDRV